MERPELDLTERPSDAMATKVPSPAGGALGNRTLGDLTGEASQQSDPFGAFVVQEGTQAAHNLQARQARHIQKLQGRQTAPTRSHALFSKGEKVYHKTRKKEYKVVSIEAEGVKVKNHEGQVILVSADKLVKL